jgi:hypothetical protein
MVRRIAILVCMAFLLVGGAASAAEKRHVQLKTKEYPITEEFRSAVEPTTPEDPVLGSEDYCRCGQEREV